MKFLLFAFCALALTLPRSGRAKDNKESESLPARAEMTQAFLSDFIEGLRQLQPQSDTEILKLLSI